MFSVLAFGLGLRMVKELDMKVLGFIQRWAFVALSVCALAAGLKIVQLESALAEAKLDAATYKLDVQIAKSAADASIRKAEQTFNTKYQGALNDARTREASLRGELAAARVVSDGLRDQNADATRRLAAASPAAILEYASTLNAVFDDCRAAYGDMAEKATGHANDAQTLIEAWPVMPPHRQDDGIFESKP